jgi:hypothetical protein
MTNTLKDPVELLRHVATQYRSPERMADKKQLLTGYIELIIRSLLANGLEYRNVLPLIDVLALIDALGGPAAWRAQRSPHSHPSPAVLARASAVIDLLIKHGRSEEAAAQILAQQMREAGVNLPKDRSGTRGWQGLRQWRRRLLKSKNPEAGWTEYERFTHALSKLRAPRAQTALNQRIWDLRMAPQTMGETWKDSSKGDQPRKAPMSVAAE